MIENWTRPLKGPHSLLHQPREDAYFNDMVQWNNRADIIAAANETAASGCTRVGMDIKLNHVEYPFQALILARKPSTQFQLTGVENPSRKYETRAQPPPCAVVCFDCASNTAKLDQYRAIGPPLTFGRTLLFKTPIATAPSSSAEPQSQSPKTAPQN